MDAPTTETFGQRVARLRVAAKMTQEQLAAKAGIPLGSLRNHEYDHRRPRADAALALARALGVTVEELLVAPSSKPARAAVQDPPGLRVLKRAWERARPEERAKFLEYVSAFTDSARGRADANTPPKVATRPTAVRRGKRSRKPGGVGGG